MRCYLILLFKVQIFIETNLVIEIRSFCEVIVDAGLRYLSLLSVYTFAIEA